jgi:hypothetical protein
MNFSISEWFNAVYQALVKSKKDLRGYGVVPLPYTTSQQVQLMRPCNGWTVINQGKTNVTVNGTILLLPQEFIAVGGNEGEEYTGYLRITFANNANPGNNAVVLQKFYEDGAAKYDKPGL